ncbi:hypothetical protein TSUD_328980 [Trifolium subterraneum]|uniref:Uncharacterized protein n=1 Tax=Trifolium subterraneum TaxID=3900 RepID=A0A2Z6LWS7_TRISU|nr:hypothetical protein TSUD_328980 [Trifolium subterraneum]
MLWWPVFNFGIELLTRLKEFNDKKVKVLIVLDDVWQELNFEWIGLSSLDHQNAIKILFTSRNEKVCQKMGSQVNVQVSVLQEDEAWILFQEMAGDIVNKKDINPIAREVAKECGGLPLAISTVGRSLGNEEKISWDVALNKLRDSQSSSFSDMQECVYKRIELSISILSSVEQKSCLFLCGLFPEDFDIPIESLLRHGVGLGIFKADDSVWKARNDINYLVKSLKKCFLLLDGEKPACVKMHDIVRDVVLKISFRELGILVQSNSDLKEVKRRKEKCLRMSLILNEKIELESDLECPRLELLQVQSKRENGDMALWPENVIHGMTKLKGFSSATKDGEVSFRSHPDPVDCKHSSDSATLFSSIWMKQFPKLESMTLLVCISIEMVFDLEGYSEPSGDELDSFLFPQLRKLVIEVSLPRVLEDRIPYISERKSKKVKSHMPVLEDLYIVNIEDCPNMEVFSRGFSDTPKLEDLSIKIESANNNYIHIQDINAVIQGFKSFVASQGFKMFNWTKLHNEGHFIKTSETYIKAFHKLVVLVPYNELQMFQHVRELTVRNYDYNIPFCTSGGDSEINNRVYDFDIMVSSIDECLNMGTFPHGNVIVNTPNLHKLQWDGTDRHTYGDLNLIIYYLHNSEKFMVELQKLETFENMDEELLGYIKRVTNLEIVNCHKLLKCIPSNMMHLFSHLEKLVVGECDFLEEIFESNDYMLQCELRHLNLFSLPKLKHIWKNHGLILGFKCLKIIIVKQCNDLEYVFPDVSMVTSLLHLVKIEVCECEQMKKIIGNNCNPLSCVQQKAKKIIFPSLSEIKLEKLPSLKCFSQSSFPCYVDMPKCYHIIIEDCPKMKSFWLFFDFD